MRIVFWNTNKNENINEYISDIIVEQEIDILVLAEYESDIEELKKMLALYNIVIEQAITIGCDRITILKRKENIQPAFQNKYCSMQIIDDMYLLVCLHLPSKLYAGVLKRGIAIARIVEEIQIHEEKLGIEKTVIVGDINEKYYYNVNLIVLYNVGASIKVSTISYPLRNGMSQKVYWTNKPVEDFLNKKLRKLFDNKSEKICIKTFKVECESQVIEKIKKEFDKRDAKGNGIPIDLFVLNQVDDRRIAYSYELKAGGNLDTKNAPSNAAEVTSLETIFSFCDKSISRFATCYDGKGDGTPDGAIGKHLDRNQILIGKEFWEEILEDGVSYNDFILAYQEAYKKAKVEETVIG